jgi:hypothetical protein
MVVCIHSRREYRSVEYFFHYWFHSVRNAKISELQRYLRREEPHPSTAGRWQCGYENQTHSGYKAKG